VKDQAELPLVDLHRHLEGAFRPLTVAELRAEHGLPRPHDPEEVRRQVVIDGVVPTLVDYLRANDFAVEALADLEACRRVAREAVEDAAAEGLGYLELRFSPGFMAAPHGLPVDDVVGAVVDGVREGQKESGLRTKLIGIMSRTFGPEACELELEALLTHRDEITGLDLAGDEKAWPGELFVDHFRRGRDAGWRITIHAGEAAGAEGVRQAIEELGAERIGHGVRAIEDSSVVDLLVERQIALEISLTSNVQTSTFPDLASHPIAELLRFGIPATVNTDNPTASATTLPRELREAAPAARLDEGELRAVRVNALEHAFLSPTERRALR
jgi:adenosine deaminase